MKITIIGTGYVGLVTGTCLAEMGNFVTCIDTEIKKIKNLQNGIIPIYERDLDALVNENILFRRLSFSSSFKNGIKDSNIFFIFDFFIPFIVIFMIIFIFDSFGYFTDNILFHII